MKHMNYLMALFLLAACNGRKAGEVHPKQLLLDLANGERFIDADQLATRMIEKDPSVRLIDVRPPDAFKIFSLPGAYNIPLKDLLKPENQALLDCSRYTPVFFSNDDLIAAHAWQINRRQGCQSCLILQGGLNEWTRRFLAPPEPPQTAAAADWEQYRFRKAVCQFFIGASDALKPEQFPELPPPALPKKSIGVRPKPQKAQAKAEEGC